MSLKDFAPENRILKYGADSQFNKARHKSNFESVYKIDEMDELVQEPHWEKENPALTTKLDRNLKQKLTDDSKAQVLIDNYGELLEKGLCERNYGYEEYIKLNRLEQLMTPKKVNVCERDIPPTFSELLSQTIYGCPSCLYRLGEKRVYKSIYINGEPYRIQNAYEHKKLVTCLNRHEKPRHCPDCGQALDWSEVKE